MFLAWYLANPRSPINVCRHILLDFTRSKKKNSEPIRMLNQVAVGIMLFAVTVSSVIGILSYEIAVVNFLFNSDDMFLEKELGSLSLKDLQQDVVVEKDGIETIFRALVGGEKSKLIKKSQLCSNPKECYDKLENDSDPAKFFFTFDNGFRYVQHETKACNLTVFKTRSPLSSVPAGWYYGSRVPKTRQIAVDKAILEHRMQHKIQTVINNGLPSANCSAKTNKIKPPFIGWLLLTVIAVCMVPILSTLIATGVLRNKTRASRGERR